jgi:hypothetical protein
MRQDPGSEARPGPPGQEFNNHRLSALLLQQPSCNIGRFAVRLSSQFDRECLTGFEHLPFVDPRILRMPEWGLIHV